MTYANGNYRWAGRVYDGPLEGEHRAEDQPYFEASYCPLSARAGVYLNAPYEMHVSRMLYRWSNPLRAWVLDWRTAPWALAQQISRDAKAMRSKCPPHFYYD